MNPAVFGVCLASVLLVPILTSFAVREVRESLARPPRTQSLRENHVGVARSGLGASNRT